MLEVVLSHHAWCLWCHAACGVVGAIVGLHGHVVAAAMLCVVSWSLLSHHIVVAVPVIMLHVVVPHYATAMVIVLTWHLLLLS